MSRFGRLSAVALALCLAPGFGASLLADGFDPLWFLRGERSPVYAPADESEIPGVVQTSHEAYAGCVSASGSYPCGSCNTCDASGCDGCLGGGHSKWDLWREHIRCRLRRHHWEKGYETCYPVCPPQCQQYYGYRPTCWRRLPPFDPCPPAISNVIITPAPQQPYGPPVDPGLTAPPAPADAVAPPLPADVPMDEFP